MASQYPSLLLMACWLLSPAFLCASTNAGVLADDPEYVYVIIFLDVERIRKADDDNQYKLFSDDEVDKVCEKYVREKLGRFHKFPEVSNFFYSDAPSIGDPDGQLHKIINYRIDISKQNEAFKYLARDPAVIQVRVDKEYVLSDSKSGQSNRTSHVILLVMEKGADRKEVQSEANAIAGAKWLFRDRKDKSSAYVICSSPQAEARLKEIRGVSSVRVLTRQELQDRGVESPEIDAASGNTSDDGEDSSGLVRRQLRLPSRPAAQKLLDFLVQERIQDVRVIDVASAKVTVAGNRNAIDKLERQFQ